MRKALVSILTLLLVFSSALAENSILSPSDIFYVNDNADVLSEETENHIVLSNNILFRDYGVQIVFVTVETTGFIKLSDYAYTLFNQWKIGGSNNNGFLLVMAINDDDYWYEIGSNLDKFISADQAGELVDTYLEPFFAVQDYDKGAEELFNVLYSGIMEALGGDAGTSTDKVDEIDLSGLSLAELDELRQRVTMAMWQTEEWQEVVVPQGEWIVGEDIPAGKWTIKCANINKSDSLMQGCNIEWGYLLESGCLANSLAKGGNEVIVYNQNSVHYQAGRITEVIADLKVGMYVRIDTTFAPALFTPYSGKPSLGFK